MRSDPQQTAPGGEKQSAGPHVHEPPIVVGIGGSAGGLGALMALLEAAGDDVPMAVVVVLHLSPDHESKAVEILQRVTPLVVSQVTERTPLQAGHVYVIAPGMDLITEDGHVQPATAATKRPSSVIDLFFRSLAQVHRERAVGIVLSGTGRDGSLGIAHVKECGGFTIAQSPEASEHNDMPRAAIATGSVDLVLPAVEIGKRLVDLARLPRMLDATAQEGDAAGATEAGSGEEPSAERAFHDVLTALRVRTRHDFRHYKRATVMRRLERRMQVTRMPSIQAYRDYVRKNPEELAPLLADMLISVTNFFRDPAAFDALQRDVVPDLMEGVPEGEELRVWVAACASGEESYSVSILLQEYADRMTQPPRIQVFASDINEAALHVARTGVYPANIAADVSESRLLGYFDKEEGDFYRVRTAVREMIVFARHNALGDPPFSRLDLICCRNLLIYLDRTAQAAALEMFAYALKPGGYLFLGNAESVDALSALFETINKEHRIYRLRPEAAATARTRIPSQLVSTGAAAAPIAGAQEQRSASAYPEQPIAALHESALVASSPPSVLINADHEIERVSNGANRFVAFGDGLPTRNLLNNVAPDIRMELRAALFSAGESRQPVRSVFRRDGANGGSNAPLLALTIDPVKDADGFPRHWLVRFEELVEGNGGPPNANDADGAPYRAAMQRLEEENRSLKAHLQDTLDRSATSNEELKASNEELQAINEELRSAKEELETSKEELQSLNEELTTVNFELRMKVEEASRNNDDLRNLMEASEIATVFVDSAMCVKRFTPQASKLFALIPSDVGRPLMDVKSRLRYDEIVEDATAVFKQLRPVERSITSVDDEHFFARILPYRTSQDKIGGAVLTFINVTELRHAEDRVRLTEERLRDAIATSKDFAVVSTDAAGRITTWNQGAERIFGYDPAEIIGKSIDVLFTPEDRAAGAPERERNDAARVGRASDERWHLRRDGTTFFCSGVMTPLHGGGGVSFVKIARDVSAAKELELQQRTELSNEQRSAAEMKHASELKDRFLAVMSHELKQPLNLINVNAELLARLPEARESPTVRRIGHTIMRAVSAQEKIVNDLLDLSRVQTGKMRLQCEATDVAQIVQQLGHAMASDAQDKGIALEVQARQPVFCNCDPVRIEQVVWNLLGNALKFTPEGGRVSIRVSTEGLSAKLEVADTGVGISADVLPGVFELFSQGAATDQLGSRRSGLGIGLALVRELVQAHRGRIEAASPGEGQGSTFTVWLPLAAEARSRSDSSPPSTLLHRRILMVDDDEDSLVTFSALLGLEGATVDTAISASAALDMLAAGHYDLVLSDIGMPEMSGLEFIKRARKLQPEKQFKSIAISGYGREVDERAALAAGFDAHLSKPVSLARLKTAMERL